ncbi:TPA: hypothetical protein ACOFC4_000259 [Stenotrophomonas maltophilia]
MTDIRSNDILRAGSAPATLATVKHGGCVQLGDGLPPLPKMQRFTNLYGETFAYSAEQMRDYARSALSAQPSPGGQGDALLESLVARWRRDADEIGISDSTLCQKIANCTMRHAAELQAALAARQPVGQISDTEIDARLNALYREMVDSGQHNGGMSGVAWDRAVFRMASRQPAQAVDLGPGIEAAAKLIQKKADDYAEEFGYDDMGGLSFGRGHHAEVKSDHHAFMLELVDELRAPIDSQAVGNG